MPSNFSASIGAIARRSRRAFSLIEMMVVLGILVVVIAIVLPAVSGARRAARKAATQNTMNQLATATNQFELDQRRKPGYFSIRDVAAATNTTGFTAMDNIMLDLAGGITQAASTAIADPCDVTAARVARIGPSATQIVNVDLQQIGATKEKAGVITKGYFAADKSIFKRQCLANTKRATVDTNILAMPTVVDAFGQPIIAWVQDDLIAPNAVFASRDYGTRARFYWQTNRGMLRATALGETGENQTDAVKGSLVSNDDAATYKSIEGVFGNPASPDTNDATKAADSRGKFIFHSPGNDGMFLGKKERGGKVAGPTGLAYQAGRDPMNDGSFDDIFQVVP